MKHRACSRIQQTSAGLLVGAALLGVVTLMGCRTAPPGPRLSEAEVMQLSSDGFSPQVLGLTSRHSGLDFTMSTEELLRLQELGLSPESIAAVLAAEADRRDEREGRRASIVRGVGRMAGTVGRLAVGFF